MHYSFDYTQQMHYPSNPLHPGPIYFLTPRKCGTFGVHCEAIPQQVNYLIDEAMESSKGSSAVVSHLHHFLNNYGLSEEYVHPIVTTAVARTKMGMFCDISVGE